MSREKLHSYNIEACLLTWQMLVRDHFFHSSDTQKKTTSRPESVLVHIWALTWDHPFLMNGKSKMISVDAKNIKINNTMKARSTMAAAILLSVAWKSVSLYPFSVEETACCGSGAVDVFLTLCLISWSDKLFCVSKRLMSVSAEVWASTASKFASFFAVVATPLGWFALFSITLYIEMTLSRGTLDLGLLRHLNRRHDLFFASLAPLTISVSTHSNGPKRQKRNLRNRGDKPFPYK